MTTVGTSKLYVGQVLEITFPGFIPGITIKSEQELRSRSSQAITQVSLTLSNFKHSRFGITSYTLLAGAHW